MRSGRARELVERPHPTFGSPVHDVETHERKPGEHGAVADRIDEERPAGTKPAIAAPPNAGPIMRDALNCAELRVIPASNCSRGTISLTIACQAGRLRPAVMPTSTETAT